MAFENENKLKLFKKHLPDFVNQIDPREILPYLECLTPTAQQEISCCQDNSGARKAVFILFQRLPQMDNWWEDFTKALRCPDINKPHLADLIDPSFKKKRKHSHLKRNVRQEVAGLSTLYRKLPHSVTQALMLLDSHEPSNRNWEALAAALDYTNEEVRRIGCPGVDPSVTSRLLTDWSTRPDSTLSNLLTALKKIGRLDLISNIQDIVFPELEREDDGGHGLPSELKPEIINSQNHKHISSTLSTTSQKYQENVEQDEEQCNTNVIPNVIYQDDKDLGKIYDGKASRETTLSKLYSFGPWVIAGSCIVPIALYFATRRQ